MIDRPVHYILEGRTARPADFLTWALWYKSAERTVAQTEIEDIIVSTVFFGLDFSMGLETAPMLFETMILGGELDGSKIRCSTWEQAEQLHARYVELVRNEIEDDTLDAQIID